MSKLIEIISRKFLLSLAAAVALAGVGWRLFETLPVDVFPDIAVPRVVLQTEAPGLTAEEVEQRVTVPIETAMNGIPGISTIRSSSSGGLSFVWVEFDWNVDLSRARFDVFERLQRVRESLPPEAEVEIAPTVSVTGEIMLVALTAEKGGVSPLELREMAEYALRPRLLGVKGIGEVAVLGGRLPEYRISVSPRRLAEAGLSVSEVVEAAKDTRTNAGAGYLPNVDGDEIPLRQIARADALTDLARSPIVREAIGSLRLGDVAEVTLAGAPRRGSASFEGREAVVLSVQKVPGGNTPEITARLDRVLSDFAAVSEAQGVSVHANAYRQADFIGESIAGGARVVRDAVVVVLIVLGLTLFRVRTILVVLGSMALTMPIAIAIFPVLGLGVNVMTLGGFAVAAGDIVDAAIIFTEAIWRRRDLSVAEAVGTVLPGVAFSTLIVALVFLPLLLLSGLEGSFFRPLALAFLAVFVTSLVTALVVTPAFSRLLGRDRGKAATTSSSDSLGVRVMKLVYRPFLALSLRVPYLIVMLAVAAMAIAAHVATGFGSSFLPPFREDSFNVALSLPPGASLDESERVAEACVAGLREIPGVLSVTRRTGRAERDQHAEPVSSSEYVIRVDLAGDVEGVRKRIREQLGAIPGCSVLVGYPIAHRISAVLSGTESELAVNVYGDDMNVLRETVAKMKTRLDAMKSVSDVRANREVTVRTFRIDYDVEALAEAGLTLREAGEQVSVAFNGLEVGEVCDGLKRRTVVVRLEGVDGESNVETVRGLLLMGRGGRCVRLEDVARVEPEEASDLMLREGGRRKALVSLNAAEGVNTGDLVAELKTALDPIARAAGCSVEYGGSYQARESAARRLAWLGAALVAVIFVLLVMALGEIRAAVLAMLNIPLGLVGGVAAVAWVNPVLSVSSLVGFVTVVGFVLRNGLLLLQRYREGMRDGLAAEQAIREGSIERMVPIVMTSLTTVFGLVPIMLAGEKPGGELLAPLAVVQFGGILGATILNLVVLPAAAKIVFGRTKGRVSATLGVVGLLIVTAGCRVYERDEIDWQAENRGWMTATEVRLTTLADVERVALTGNAELNRLRLKLAKTKDVVRETGWWEDPELDYDLLRIVNPTENPFLMGASLAFTLPLSGVPGLEGKAAEAYAAADAADIVVKEREVAAEARREAVRLVMSRKLARPLEEFDADPRIREALASAEKLAEVGELSRTELASAKRRSHERLHRLQRAELDADEAESALRKALGLAPSVKISVSQTLGMDEAFATNDLPREALAYVRHPRVKAALQRLEGGEAALETEIRKQYPELKLGPAYGYEEGMDRFGFTAGLTLPLWNRNRKGIATAEGDRADAKAAAVQVWREVVQDADAALRILRRLHTHHPDVRQSVSDINTLADAGELNALEYIAVREELLEAVQVELEWRRDVRLAEEEVRKFNF